EHFRHLGMGELSVSGHWSVGSSGAGVAAASMARASARSIPLTVSMLGSASMHSPVGGSIGPTSVDHVGAASLSACGTRVVPATEMSVLRAHRPPVSSVASRWARSNIVLAGREVSLLMASAPQACKAGAIASTLSGKAALHLLGLELRHAID